MSDKSAAVALFYPFSLLTVNQACVLWMPQRWSYYTHKAEPGLILLLFCSVTMQGSFYEGASIQISVVQDKQNEAKVMQCVERLLPLQADWSVLLIGLKAQSHFNIPKFTLKHLALFILFHFP